MVISQFATLNNQRLFTLAKVFRPKKQVAKPYRWLEIPVYPIITLWYFSSNMAIGTFPTNGGLFL